MDVINDMSLVIIPRSDQLNADDLIIGPMTITVTSVTLLDPKRNEQPVIIHYENDQDKPYKPCMSMSRVLVLCWGRDANNFIGRRMTLHRDPRVTFGPTQVGGIRITHLSHIDAAKTMALTDTRKSRKPFTVEPLKTEPVAPTTKKPPSIAEWIGNSLRPALLACGDIQAVARVQQSKQYLGAWKAAGAPEQAEMQHLVDVTIERIEAAEATLEPTEEPPSEPVAEAASE